MKFFFCPPSSLVPAKKRITSSGYPYFFFPGFHFSNLHGALPRRKKKKTTQKTPSTYQRNSLIFVSLVSSRVNAPVHSFDCTPRSSCLTTFFFLPSRSEAGLRYALPQNLSSIWLTRDSMMSLMASCPCASSRCFLSCCQLFVSPSKQLPRLHRTAHPCTALVVSEFLPWSKQLCLCCFPPQR